MDNGSVLLQHEMPMISFASGGDSDSLDYIAYVAKDSSGGRLVLIYIPYVAKDSSEGRLVLIIFPMLPRIVQKEG